MSLLAAHKGSHFRMLKHWVCLKYQTTALQMWSEHEHPSSFPFSNTWAIFDDEAVEILLLYLIYLCFSSSFLMVSSGI